MAYVLRSIRNEPERIWTSTEPYEIYVSKEATDTSGVHFLYSLEEKLGKNYYILKASELAAICIRKEKVASILKVTLVTDDPDEEVFIKVAKIIKAHIAKKTYNVSTYSSLNTDTLNENTSNIFSFSLSQISPKLKDGLVAQLINHMVIQVMADNFNPTINSQNGIKQFHTLASIFAQENCSDEDNNEFKFPQLKQEDI